MRKVLSTLFSLSAFLMVVNGSAHAQDQGVDWGKSMRYLVGSRPSPKTCIAMVFLEPI